MPKELFPQAWLFDYSVQGEQQDGLFVLSLCCMHIEWFLGCGLWWPMWEIRTWASKGRFSRLLLRGLLVCQSAKG